MSFPSEPTCTHNMPGAWSSLLSRRDLLRLAGLSVAGTLLPDRALSVPSGGKNLQQDSFSVIVLWMAGGMTHIDSFDPKPEAPEEIRGSLKAIRTTVPGVSFCETMPCLARLAHRLTVVRTYASGNNDHFRSQASALSGRSVTRAQITSKPNVGAVVSHVLGGRAGLPGYLAVPGTTRPGPPPKNLFVAGWIGQQHAPFATGGKPRNPDFTAGVHEAPEEELNLQALRLPPGTDAQRLARRRSLQTRLDSALQGAEQQFGQKVPGMPYHAAFTMLLSPQVRRAFDLQQESDRVRERYGRTKLGQRCLLARRLVEAGARFVLVDYGYDPEYGNLWDNHNAPVQKFPPICEMVKKPYHLAGLDRAFAALLTDLEARGRLDNTLIVLLTEFGRTPKINKRAGRDHWGNTGSIVFAGGRCQVGQVIGETDRQAAEPRGQAFHPGDVAATIYQALGIPLDTQLRDPQGRPLPLLPEGTPIPGVLPT